MNDMSTTIIPKSDQLNADSLLSGPITVRITGVEIAMGEQPVTIHYAGENGRPYKPGKSMRRVLVAMWGADANIYTGRSLTLYCDASVKFGGMEVGGIRISHMSDITGPATMALTETKGKKKPFIVRPLVIPVVSAASPPRPKFSDWLAGYAERLKTAADRDAAMDMMAQDETAITTREKGGEAQKKALAAADAAALAAFDGATS